MSQVLLLFPLLSCGPEIKSGLWSGGNFIYSFQVLSGIVGSAVGQEMCHHITPRVTTILLLSVSLDNETLYSFKKSVSQLTLDSHVKMVLIRI